MTVPRVREKVVRAQTAILASALLYDGSGDRSRLRGGDYRRATERLVVPGVAQTIVRPVYLWRTGDDAIVVAGKLQGFVNPLPTSRRASEEIRVIRAFPIKDFDDLLGAYRHQMGRSRPEVDLLLGMAGQHPAAKWIGRYRRRAHVGVGHNVVESEESGHVIIDDEPSKVEVAGPQVSSVPARVWHPDLDFDVRVGGRGQSRRDPAKRR